MLHYPVFLQIFATSLLLISNNIYALDKDFSIKEYTETLKMNFCQVGKLYDTTSCKPADWQRLYRSPIVGMDNRFDVWKRDGDSVIGISLRGTTPRAISWMENFYAAMVPAQGLMQINDSVFFEYCFAKKEDAAVHVGWTYALGAMHIDLLDQVKLHYAQGNKNVLLFGHSQGGALAILAYAYFHYLKKSGALPSDIRFKMVASAAPKVGNIHFAYDFEAYTPNVWAFNVINPEDWIPLMPFAVQTTDDMTSTHPFVFIKEGLKTQKFPDRLALSAVYNDMNRKMKKARKSLQKNLGKRVGLKIKKERPQYVQPNFHHSMHYTRSGNHIIFEPNDAYYQQFPKRANDIFAHHMLDAYLFLADIYQVK